MIIVEGVDNSGKTRLVEWLIEKLPGVKVIHSHGPVQSELMVEQLLADINMAYRYQKPIVFDRFPLISEEIYGSVLRGGNLFTKSHDRELLMEWFRSLAPLIIHCRPAREIVIGSISDRLQMDGVVNNIDKLIDAYDDLMAELNSRGFITYIYDYTRDKDRLWKMVTQYLL